VERNPARVLRDRPTGVIRSRAATCVTDSLLRWFAQLTVWLA
jgi:hypothetical protein